jgi:uncharacterized protein (DUF1501 family)
MKRRTFIKTAAAGAAAAPIVLGGLPLRAQSSLEMLAQMPAEDNDRILVIIQLFGGNDGLNTLIPALDDEYYRIRPGINVPKKDCWNGVGDIFLHPALATGSQGGVARMLENGTLALVQGVGYENPNLSHFRSTDIWLSGINSSDPNVRLDTGWVGRYLASRHPDFPASLPEHPLAIQFGGSFSLTLLSDKGRMGIEVTDPSGQKGVGLQLDTLDADAANTNYYDEYQFVADIASRSNLYAQAVKDAYAAGLPKLQGDYGASTIAKQIGSVGALIAGGLKTKVYVLSMGGFDTHTTQQYFGNGGTHPSLLSRFSDGVAQFMHDMTKLGYADKIVGLTVSEFGRRPYENGSLGTDHGTASVQFVFGTQVNSGVFGNAPNLKNVNGNGDFYYQIDYREVYGEILTDWFGLTMGEMRDVLQKDDIIPLDVLKSQASSVARDRSIRGGVAITSVAPNPFGSATTLEFIVDRPGHVRLQVAALDGRVVATPVDRYMEAGDYRVPVMGDFPSGTYLCTLRAGDRIDSRPVQCVR